MEIVKSRESTEFYDWVKRQLDTRFTLKEYTLLNSDNIAYETDAADALITFNYVNNSTIMEYCIKRKRDGETVFYLHFELNDVNHAKDLFREMMSSLEHQDNARKTKVLLCCSSAITTSFFVEKMRNAVEVLELDMEFSAVSYNNLYGKGFEADLVLLAPQVAYLYPVVKEILKKQIVAEIPPAVYAAYDITGLMAFVRKLLEEKKEEEVEKKLPIERVEYKNTPMILLVSIIVEYRQVRLIYRIYERGKALGQDMVIKEVFRLRDLQDMMDVVFARYPDIEMVCVSTPGVVYDGCLTFRSSNIWRVNVTEMFEDLYHREFIFCNDANTMALGYYSMQKESRNVSFYFHPHAARTSGVGNVINGHLHTGRHNLSGEMQYVHKMAGYSDDPEKLALTPEGTLEIVSKYMITMIANVDPEVIAVYCDMVPDMELLRKKIAETVQEEFIPKLEKVTDVIEYMFAGGMMRCTEALTKRRMAHGERYKETEGEEDD